jgi:hypothetical protein
VLKIGWIISTIALSGWGAPRLQPTFASQVNTPEASIVLPLLRAACGDGVRVVTAKGMKALGCGDGSMDEILASRKRGRRYPWMPYVLWEADGVIFGHFLSPTSEDAAVNCFACDGHAELYGGTLLLTKKSGEWEPVWYKAGIITRHCRRVSLATGRQILFCEETDGGMGHDIHGVYIVDFTNPKFAWDSVVLMADSYSDAMLGGACRSSPLIGSRSKTATEARFWYAFMPDMAGSSCARNRTANVCPYRNYPTMKSTSVWMAGCLKSRTKRLPQQSYSAFRHVRLRRFP